MLRRHMLNIRAGTVVIRSSRIHANQCITRARIFAGARVMTMSLVWTGVALWLGFNVAVVARRIYVTRPVKVADTSRRPRLHLV
jgi:hypothetical protein